MKISKIKLQQLINEAYKKIVQEIFYVDPSGNTLEVPSQDPYIEIIHPSVREKVSRDDIIDDVKIANTAISVSAGLRNDPNEKKITGQELQEKIKLYDTIYVRKSFYGFDRRFGYEESKKVIELLLSTGKIGSSEALKFTDPAGNFKNIKYPQDFSVYSSTISNHELPKHKNKRIVAGPPVVIETSDFFVAHHLSRILRMLGYSILNYNLAIATRNKQHGQNYHRYKGTGIYPAGSHGFRFRAYKAEGGVFDSQGKKLRFYYKGRKI